MNMINIISWEQNDNYQYGKAYDGGCYGQPFITFEFKGKRGTFDDSSCGSFGRRYYINYDNKYHSFDSIGNEYDPITYSSFDADDSEFINAFFDKFGILIPID